MTALRLLALPGDGSGPEITKATLRVLRAVAPPVSCPVGIKKAQISLAALKAQGTTIPDSIAASTGVLCTTIKETQP